MGIPIGYMKALRVEVAQRPPPHPHDRVWIVRYQLSCHLWNVQSDKWSIKKQQSMQDPFRQLALSTKWLLVQIIFQLFFNFLWQNLKKIFHDRFISLSFPTIQSVYCSCYWHGCWMLLGPPTICWHGVRELHIHHHHHPQSPPGSVYPRLGTEERDSVLGQPGRSSFS